MSAVKSTLVFAREWVFNLLQIRNKQGESHLKNGNRGSLSAILTLRVALAPQKLARVLACFITACSAVAASTALTPLWAQAFPNKPVRIILGVTSGNPGDVRARQIAAKFPDVFGQSLVVENRPGGNSFIAAEAVARAPADGYTLLLGNSPTHSVNPWAFQKMPYRDVEDFAPVTLVSAGPLILAVNAALPVRTIGELITLAKAKPGELNYGIGGTRGTASVAMEQIKRATGVNIVGVPYKAPGADLMDAVAGTISITFNFWSILEPQVKAGKLKVLAVAAPSRLAAVPDLPTFAEAGIAGVEVFGWQGIYAPAGTPRDVIDRLQKGFAQILQAPALRDELIRTGAIVGGNSPEEFAAFVRVDKARMGKAFADMGMSPE
jgi:tripartite-type tricarboxylate transporter receptor subunit TctC